MGESIQQLGELGLLLVPDFFSAGLCRQLSDACDAQSRESASILINGAAAVDPKVRRAECCDIDDNVLSGKVKERLDFGLRQAARHYAVDLVDYEVPQIVRYPAGGFYRAHIDCEKAEPGRTRTQARKVSCVVFLNSSGQSNDVQGFTGGALAFFGLTKDPTSENYKTLLYPQQGLLVAFRSDLYHEVMPVTAGNRFTLVTWFR